MNFLAFMVFFCGLLFSVSWILGFLALGTWRVSWRFAGRRPSLERIVPLTLLLPFVLAVALTVAATVPLGHDCHCQEVAGVGVHLCVAHPAGSLSIFRWAFVPLAVLALRVVRIAPSLLNKLRLGCEASRSSSLLARVPASFGNAFSVSLPRPRIVVDRALWYGLAPQERRIVLAHEVAHLRRGDPLLLELLSIVSIFLPRGLSAFALDRWREHAECQADAIAARETSDPYGVAALLVKLQSLAQAAPAPVVAFRDGPMLETRVRALLEETTAVCTFGEYTREAFFLTAAAVALPLFSSHQIHHIFESLLGSATL